MSTALIIKRRLKVFAISLVFIVLILVATFVIFNNNDFKKSSLKWKWPSYLKDSETFMLNNVSFKPAISTIYS